MTYEPPVCPECQEPILSVLEVTYETYIFNGKGGAYSCDDFSVTMDIKCSNCDADLRDVFVEGACNYSVKEIKEGQCEN